MAAPYFRLDQKFEYPCHPILPLLEFLWKRSLAMFQGWSWPIQLETKPEEVLKLKAKREARGGRHQWIISRECLCRRKAPSSSFHNDIEKPSCPSPNPCNTLTSTWTSAWTYIETSKSRRHQWIISRELRSSNVKFVAKNSSPASNNAIFHFGLDFVRPM